MTLLQQLDQSALSQSMVLPYAFPLSNSTLNFGLLANKSMQIRGANAVDAGVHTINLPRPVTQAWSTFRLGLLKQQKFTSQGREQRIARSLAALNTQQPTELTLEQWKAIIEEVEDED